MNFEPRSTNSDSLFWHIIVVMATIVFVVMFCQAMVQTRLRREENCAQLDGHLVWVSDQRMLCVSSDGRILE